MNNLTIAGNIGRDAELRRLQDGTPVAQFSVAVSNGKDKQGNRRDSTWFDCSLWGKRGEALSQYLTKGGKVAVSGLVSARAHESKAYLQLRVNEITMLGGGSDNQPRQEPAKQDDFGDEIPF
jgi:single-strand DNA-binding protein